MKHLYSRLAEEFPLLFGKNSVYAVHAERFKEDFEGTFADVVLKYARGGGFGPSTPPTLILLEQQGTLARYFSRFILDSAGSDCYSKLLLALKKSGMIQQSIFGSLNYECLLEQSADGLDLTVDYWCDQNHPDVVSLAKIHGSCNFVTQRFDRHQQAMLSAQAGFFGVEVTPLCVHDLEQALSAQLAAGSFPVMSQISASKENFVDSTKFRAARNTWQEGVSNARDKVIVIGVSCNPNDSHILEPIKEVRVPLLYIGGDFAKWKETNSGFKYLGETFEDGLEHLLNSMDI